MKFLSTCGWVVLFCRALGKILLVLSAAFLDIFLRNWCNCCLFVGSRRILQILMGMFFEIGWFLAVVWQVFWLCIDGIVFVGWFRINTFFRWLGLDLLGGKLRFLDCLRLVDLWEMRKQSAIWMDRKRFQGLDHIGVELMLKGRLG